MIPLAQTSVERVFDSYPDLVRFHMIVLRDLIFATAQSLGLGATLTETLKWGEPSYASPSGSTLRMHWKPKDPEHYRLFFHCQTKLISTFRDLFPNDFDFEANRAIRLSLKSDPDFRKLATCIEMSLTYHLVKHLPRLGVPLPDTES